MIYDQNIYNLGDITHWPQHWVRKIKKIITKINPTTFLLRKHNLRRMISNTKLKNVI